MTQAPEPTYPFQALLDDVHRRLLAMDMPRAFQLARTAVEAAGSAVERIGARYGLAKCHYVAGEIDVAMALAAEVCETASQAGEPLWLARAQTIAARCLGSAGESAAALDMALMALQELESLGRADDDALAAQQAAVMAMGVVYLRLGDLSLAMEWCQRGADLARSLRDPSACAGAIDTVACVHGALAARARDAGEPDEAERLERLAIACSTEALALAAEAGHVDYEASALMNLAESLTLVGDAPQALDLLHDWQAKHPAALPRQLSHLHDSLGQVLLATGQAEAAAVSFQEALRQCESDVFRAVVAEHLSVAFERSGRWREALEQYKAFHALQSRIATERAQRSARVAVARLDIERERARARQLDSSNKELRRRAEDLARQANEDPLTGLPNRRQVDQLLAQWPRPIALALIDVDHFKQVNDRFSHAVGDLVLKQVASTLRSTCRPSDVAARLGGEEFVVILECSQGADPAAAAERLREAVETLRWQSISAGLRVTVSIGLATAAEAADGPGLLAIADRRLYAAKRAGRNRLVASG